MSMPVGDYGLVASEVHYLEYMGRELTTMLFFKS